MIRKGKYKYIHCDVDPPMLFDIETDPMEQNNLAGDPALHNVVSAFASEVSQRWNGEQIRQHVIATQKQRRAVHAAMEAGLIIYPGKGTIDGKHGDHVLIAPPFIASEDELTELVDKLGQVGHAERAD